MDPGDLPTLELPCPSPDELAAFCAGSLSPERISSVRAHLSRCSSCRTLCASLDPGQPAPSTDQYPGGTASTSFPGGDRPGSTSSEPGSFSRVTTKAPPAPGAMPRQLGQYRLEERLGRGGMGTVYRAFHLRLKRPVALKVLPSERMHDPQAVARFFREMEAIGLLDDPHLVRAADAGEIEGVHYLVMELVEGADLGEVVRRWQRLSVADACEVARQTAQGLACITRHGLVHRDIKPSNLILSRAGQVKILDLGLARLPAGEGASELSGGMIFGTADYMAPEQWGSTHPVDVRSDLYSLGCTLYKLLTGQAPFSGPDLTSHQAKKQAHLQLPPPPLRDARPDVPEPLASLMDRLLAKRPEQRPATPEEVARVLEPMTAGADLARLVETTSSAAPRLPPSPPSRAAEPAPPPASAPPRRWPGLFLALLLLVGAAAGWLAWQSAGLLPPSPHDPPAAPPAPDPDASRQVGVSQQMLGPDITPRRWPQDEGKSRWQWLSARHQLDVEAHGVGILELGRTTAPGHTLELVFQQEVWGGVGIVFGCQEVEVQGRPALRYQCVELGSAPGGRGQQATHRLRWFRQTYSPVTKSGKTSVIGATPLPLAGQGEHKLTLRLSGADLTAVLWNEAEVPALVTGEIVRLQRPAPGPEYLGGFGVLVTNGTCVVRSFRILVQEAPDGQ